MNDAKVDPLASLASDTRHRESVNGSKGFYMVPPAGLLESFAIIPADGFLLPNTDARAQYRLRVSLQDVGGNEIPVRVFMDWREVRCGPPEGNPDE